MKHNIISKAWPTAFLFIGTTFLGVSAFAGVQLCTGVNVDNSGATDASRGIQSCFNQLPSGATLAFPSGTYRVDHQIKLSKPLLLTTLGVYGSTQICKDDGVLPCAKIISGSTLTDNATLFGDQNAQGYTIDHLVFDGNRTARLNGAQAFCGAGNGLNVLLWSGQNARVQYSLFKNTLCATALGIAIIPSSNLIVYSNIFSNNGDHFSNGLWADGITIGSIRSSYILSNYFYNNSDVSLILGGGVDSLVSKNVIQNTWNGSFASIMLMNWTIYLPQNQMEWADFRGMWLTNNFIDTESMTDIGIQVGVTAWGSPQYCGSLRTLGAYIAGNTVRSSKQGINFTCAGAPGYEPYLGVNSWVQTGPFLTAGASRQVPTSLFNIQDINWGSFVQIDPSNPSYTNNNWDNAF